MMALPIAMLLILGAGVYLLAAPERTLLLIPFLLAFEYRIRAGGLSIEASELCVAIVLFVWLAGSRNDTPDRATARMPSNGLLVAAIALAALSGAFLENDFHHALSVYRDLTLPLVFLLGFQQLKLDRATVSLLIKLMCVLAVANACLGFVQYFTGAFLGNLKPDDFDWQEYKTGLARMTPLGQFLGVGTSLPAGLYSTTNNFAEYLSAPLCLVSTLTFSRELSWRQRLLCAVAGGVMLCALVLSLFRSGLLVYVISMLLVFLFRGKNISITRLVLVLGVVGVLASIFLTPGFADFDQFGSLGGRVDMYSEALNLIGAHPIILLTGGFTDFYLGHYLEIQNIHNVVLYATVQFGLPATVCFLAIFARFVWRAAAVASASPAGVWREVLLAITVSVAANVFLYGQTTMLIDSVQMSIWLFFWMGCATYIAEDLQKAPARAVAFRVVAAPATG